MQHRKSLRSRLVDLPIGGSEAVSLDNHKSASIRNCASLLGLDLQRKYEVHIDKAIRCCYITRTA